MLYMCFAVINVEEYLGMILSLHPLPGVQLLGWKGLEVAA